MQLLEASSCYTHVTPSRESSKQSIVSNVLEIIPLGGIGEFGMNCTLLRFGDEMIVVDAGMGFPEESVYGVDVSIPDFEILEQYREEITAIVLTHGHEDHLGALPYILIQRMQRSPAARLQNARLFRPLKRFLPKRADGLSSRHLLRRFIVCRLFSTSPSNSIAKSVCSAARCRRMSRLRTVWGISTFMTGCWWESTRRSITAITKSFSW